MKKLYKEQHYRQYCEFMNKIADEWDFAELMVLNNSFKEWLCNNNITSQMKEQMDKRLEQEDINGDNS